MAKIVLTQSDSSYFSHVGLLLKTTNGISVVHAIPPDLNNQGAVLIESLSDFFSFEKASAGSIFRLRGISSRESKLIIDYALKNVDKPFDNNYLYSDDSTYYCTELVLKSLAAGGKDIKSNVKAVDILTISEPVVLPDNLRLSKKLEKILDIEFKDK